jgi:hypothetical protein
VKAKILLFFFSCLIFTELNAGQFLNGQFVMGDTSNDVDWQEYEVGFKSSERNILWRYKNEKDQASSWGFNYYHRLQKGRGFSSRLNEVQGSYDYIIENKHHLKTNLGLYHIDEVGVETKKVHLLGNVEVTSLFNKDFWTQFSVGRNSGYKDMFLINTGAESVRNTKVEGIFQHQFFSQLFAVKANYAKSFLRNDVERDFLDSELMFSLMKFPHWIRLGFGYHSLSFNKDVSQYWSPTDFYAYGPRLDFNYSFTDKWMFFFGGNLNKFKENKQFSGTGHYLRTGFKYGIREDMTIEAFHERVKASLNTAEWLGRSYFLTFTKFL